MLQFKRQIFWSIFPIQFQIFLEMLLFKQLKKLFWQKQKYSEKVHGLGYRMMYIPFLTVVCVGFENGLKKWYQSTPNGIKVLHLPTGLTYL